MVAGAVLLARRDEQGRGSAGLQLPRMMLRCLGRQGCKAARCRALAAARTAALARHSLAALPARLQQPASCATLLVVRLLRWGDLVRW